MHFFALSNNVNHNLTTVLLITFQASCWY